MPSKVPKASHCLVVSGSDVCDWICQEVKCTRQDAVKYGEALTVAGSVVPVNCTLFRDKLGSFYRFGVRHLISHI